MLVGPSGKGRDIIWRLESGTCRAQIPYMTESEFSQFCSQLPATTNVRQWGDANVWKVGGKVFAIGGWSNYDMLAITFKVSPLSFDILKEQPGLRPAPYLAARGFKWIQNFELPGLSDDALRDYIKESHRLVADGLSKKRRSELGLA